MTLEQDQNTSSFTAICFVLPSAQMNATLNGYQLITNISAALLGYRQYNFYNGVLQLLIGCETNMPVFLAHISGRAAVQHKSMPGQLKSLHVVENYQLR